MQCRERAHRFARRPQPGPAAGGPAAGRPGLQKAWPAGAAGWGGRCARARPATTRQAESSDCTRPSAVGARCTGAEKIASQFTDSKIGPASMGPRQITGEGGNLSRGKRRRAPKAQTFQEKCQGAAQRAGGSPEKVHRVKHWPGKRGTSRPGKNAAARAGKSAALSSGRVKPARPHGARKKGADRSSRATRPRIW